MSRIDIFMRIQGKNAKEIQESIRFLISQGVYQEGDTLPNIRELAKQLSVNRNTISTAYTALAKLGVIQTNKRLGTQVRYSKSRGGEGSQPNLSPELIDIAHGNPNRDLLPNLQSINFQNVRAGLYGEDIYHQQLKKYAETQIFSDIFTIHPEACLALSYGAIDGIERILSAYLLAQDHVAIESPGFINSIKILENNHFQIHSIQVNHAGFNLTDIENALNKHVKALIITPRAHNPTGYSLNRDEAILIKNLLAAYPNTLVLIDDHFSAISHAEYYHIIPETTQNWAVLRSVSKYLGPDLRFCFICCDPHTSALLDKKMNSGTSWVSHLLQNIVYQLLTAEKFEQHLKQVKQYYSDLNHAFVNLMQQKQLKCAKQFDGLNVWLELDTPKYYAQALLERGWLVRTGEDFFVENTQFGLRITLSELSQQDIAQLVDDLADIVAKNAQQA